MLPKSVVNFDLNLFNTFYNRFLNITSNGMKKWQNLTLRLDTSEVRSHMFKTRVKMSWPSLIHGHVDNKSVILFPLTQIGSKSFRNITVKNPSSSTLMVQILLDRVYPNIELLYEGLPAASLPEYLPSSDTDNFFFVKNAFNTKQFFERTGIKVHSSTFPLLLKPGENRTITVGFKGEKVGEFSTLLFFRNNLTVMEVLRLKGRSTEPVFRFGNRKPGAVQPLMFEFTEKYGKECVKDKFKYHNPNIAIKRSFTARNTGEIPILITNFYINDAVCEGYGFKVLNCAPFSLPPNGTKKIDIEFTPDFILAKVVRTLILESTSNYHINYTLQATVPSYYISLCSGLITRARWEWYVGSVTAIFMTVTLTFTFFMAILDAEKIKKQMIDVIVATAPSVQPVLDLRLVGQQVREEVKNVKVETKEEVPKPEVKASKTEGETARAPSVAPTKGKKKLGKRVHIEDSEFVESPKPAETVKHKTTVDKKDKEDEKKSSHNKENRKVSSKKTTKPPVEEEPSSTKESGCNTDDIQEVKEIVSKPNPKKIVKPEVVPEKIEEPLREHPQNKQEKKKPSKIPLKPKEQIDNSKNQPSPVGKNECRKRFVKDFREKTPLKKTIERPCPKMVEQQSPLPQVTLPATRVWSENRASFSDVVARSDNLSGSRLGSSSNQPNLYVDKYNQTTTPLGPIGSRPVDYWANLQASSQQSSHEHKEPSQSFFSTSHEPHTAPTNYNSNYPMSTWRNTFDNYQYDNKFRDNTSAQQPQGSLVSHHLYY